MPRYLATVNTPGYLPVDDDPPIFDEAREAWEYLAGERRRDEDDVFEDGGGEEGYTAVYSTLSRLAEDGTWAARENAGVDPITGCGTVYGPTPGRAADDPRDLGVAYSVTEIDDDEEIR